MKRSIASAVGVLVLLLLAGCGEPGPGVVKSRWTSLEVQHLGGNPGGRVIGATWVRHVRVRQDDGHVRDADDVSEGVYRSCTKGKRWPECKP